MFDIFWACACLKGLQMLSIFLSYVVFNFFRAFKPYINNCYYTQPYHNIIGYLLKMNFFLKEISHRPLNVQVKIQMLKFAVI